MLFLNISLLGVLKKSQEFVIIWVFENLMSQIRVRGWRCLLKIGGRSTLATNLKSLNFLACIVVSLSVEE